MVLIIFTHEIFESGRYNLYGDNIFTTDGALIMEDTKTWDFPKNISIEQVSTYVDQLKYVQPEETVTFDLSKTVNIHSSFIGFLLHAKQNIGRNGGKLVLILSLTLEKILIMLNILDYFSPEIITIFNQKTA
jgi:hypothetical protein